MKDTDYRLYCFWETYGRK